MAIEHRDLVGAQLHEPKGADTALAGTVYTSDGLGSGTWLSPIKALYDANKFQQTQRMDDIGTDSSVYFNVPWKSELTKVNVLLYGTIDVDTLIQVYIGGVLFADSLTITAAGTAAGQKKTLTVSTANSVPAGTIVTITSNGAPTVAVKADVQLELNKVV